MANFSDLMEKYGSVEKALAATGATKNSDGSWTASDGKSTSGSSSGSSGGSTAAASVSSGGTTTNPYANTDYHAAAVAAAKAGDWAGVLQNLDWREQKINEQYGGVYGNKKTNAQIIQELKDQYPQAYIDYESGNSGAKNNIFDISELTSGAASGLTSGAASGLTSGAASGLTSGAASGLTSGTASGLTSELISELISQLTSAAPEYEGSKWDPVLERVAQELSSMNYADWTNGDEYASLSARYSGAGQQAMQDVLGQISSRTGGLASSYAATAANRQYDDYMSKLEEVARQLYDDERSAKLQEAQLYRQYSQDDYDKYIDQLNQWNTDRSYAYNKLRDQLSDLRYTQEYTDSRNDLAYNRDLQSQQQNLSQQEALAKLLASFGDYSGYQNLYGLTDEQIAAMTAYVQAQKQTSSKSSSGSSGGGSGNNSATGNGDYDSLFSDAEASGNPQSFISNNYKKYGFTSSTGLYNDYKNSWISGGLDSSQYSAVKRSLNEQLSNGRLSNALSYLNSVWENLSKAQQSGIQSLLNKYGIESYNP